MILLVLLLVLQLISPVVDGKLLEINIHGLGKSGQDARMLSFDTTQGNVKDAVQSFCRVNLCAAEHAENIANALAHMIREQQADRPSYPPFSEMLQSLHSRVPDADWAEYRSAKRDSPAVLILNMDRSKQRLEQMEIECANHHVRCFRYPAFDGTGLHVLALKDAGIVGDHFPFNRKGNAAVALSHMSMWSAMVHHGISRLVIVEDDVHFANSSAGGVQHDWPRLLRDALHDADLAAVHGFGQPGWDMVHLGHNPYMCAIETQSPQLVSALTGRSMSKPTRECMSGFFGYAISLQGAKKALGLLQPLEAAIDDMMRPHFGTQPQHMQVLIANPPLIHHDFSVESERVMLHK